MWLIIIRPNASFFKLGYHPILLTIIERIFIPNGWFNNHGKFKPGDKVKYNFFAKVMIPSIAKQKGYEEGHVFVVKDYFEWSKKKQSIEFEGGDGCDVFWIRKLYVWERLKLWFDETRK